MIKYRHVKETKTYTRLKKIIKTCGKIKTPIVNYSSDTFRAVFLFNNGYK